jgi:hypothetical protein
MPRIFFDRFIRKVPMKLIKTTLTSPYRGDDMKREVLPEPARFRYKVPILV